MKYATLIARILLGALFVFSGANLLLNFMHAQLPAGDAGTLSAIMGQAGWMKIVGLIQVIGGVLLLVGRYVPLGLTLLCPVIVNIVLFHALLLPKGLPMALVVTLFAAFLLFVYRRSFYGLFHADPEIIGSTRL